MKELNLPVWYMNENFTQEERYAIENAINCEFVKETAKAQLIKWNTKYGNITKWIPKSVIEGTYKRVSFEGAKKAITLQGLEVTIVKDEGLFSRASDGKAYLTSTLKFI